MHIMQLNFNYRQFFNKVYLFEPEFVESTLRFIGAASRWLLARVQEGTMPSLPSHLLDDLLLIVIGISKHAPDSLMTANNSGKTTPSPLASLFDCVVAFLAKPFLIHSPHILARLGEVLYETYLDPSVKPGDNRMKEGPHHQILRIHPRSVADLAPALLALYGAVEHISEQEKIYCRIHCARILKFLWSSSSSHQATFRRISADHSTFVRFANGLMNETNWYVAKVIEKLIEVTSVQRRMSDASQWSIMNENERNEVLERHASNERELRYYLPMCNETIHTVCYLSSDPEIRTPFLLPALLDRLASMLLSVLVQLVGSKGLEIKVDNPESYDFKPKVMLGEICETIANFAASPVFQQAVSKSGYYVTNPTVLPKAVNTVKKHRILSLEQLELLDRLCAAAAEFKANTVEEDADGEAPDHFLDPLLCTVMSDPVRLPMGTVIDRSTIEQHLLNDPMDPFSRQPLTLDQLVPEDSLKAEIDAWRASRTSRKDTS
jgi:ubiquitin conjugation factor E4 B